MVTILSPGADRIRAGHLINHQNFLESCIQANHTKIFQSSSATLKHDEEVDEQTRKGGIHGDFQEVEGTDQGR